MKQTIKKHIMKERNGTGIHNSIPPNTYCHKFYEEINEEYKFNF